MALFDDQGLIVALLEGFSWKHIRGRYTKVAVQCFSLPPDELLWRKHEPRSMNNELWNAIEDTFIEQTQFSSSNLMPQTEIYLAP